MSEQPETVFKFTAEGVDLEFAGSEEFVERQVKRFRHFLESAVGVEGAAEVATPAATTSRVLLCCDSTNCNSDADLDGEVEQDDLDIVNEQWDLVCFGSSSGTCLRGDVNRDSVVGIDDYLQVLADWGSCP